MARHDLSLVRGETLADVVFALTNPDGTAYDLTGASARLEVWTRPDGCACTTAESTKIIELRSTSLAAPRLVIDALDGEITFALSTSNTSAWTVGDHAYRLWLIDAAGAARIAFEGFFTVSA